MVVTDSHSGRILGSSGHWLPDLVTVFWVVSIMTGLGMLLYRRLWLAPKVASPTTADEVRRPVTAEIEPQ